MNKVPKLITKRPTVFLNDRHLEELGILGHKALPSDQKETGYDKTFKIDKLEDLDRILSDSDQRKSIKKTISDFGFRWSTCTFIFSRPLELDDNRYAKLIKYQKGVFSEVTLPFDERSLLSFQKASLDCIYQGLLLAVQIDPQQKSQSLEKVATILEPAKSSGIVKVRYRQVKKFTGEYAFIRGLFRTRAQLHLVWMGKGFTLSNFNSLALEFLMKRFGYDAFTRSIRKKITRSAKPRMVIPKVFDTNTLVYTPGSVDDFKKQGFRDLANIHRELHVYSARVRANEEDDYVHEKQYLLEALAILGL